MHSTNFGCLDINGQRGIIGTPVIDKVRGVLYVVALTRAELGADIRQQQGALAENNSFNPAVHE